MRQKIDMSLVKLNDTLRSKLRKLYQPSIFTETSSNRFLEMTYTGGDMDYKKIFIASLLEDISIIR